MENKNPKPEENGSSLPSITLAVLIGLVCLILFFGWKYISDDGINENELTNKRPIENVEIASAEEPNANSDNEVSASNSTEKIEKLEKSSSETTKKEEKPEKATVVEVEGKAYTHTVGDGETFLGIANRYGFKLSQLQSLNPDIDPSGIKVGVTKINLKVKAVHTVGPGDILRVVAEKYGISKESLMRANKKQKDKTERGEILVIPVK